MHRYFTISNLLSSSRIFLVIPMGYCLMADFPHHRLWTVIIIVVAVATDFLDGFLARRLHQVTDFGKIMDPLADKIAVGVYALLMMWAGEIEPWYVILVLARDILIFAGGMYIKHKKKIVPQSNWPGKISVSLIAFVLFLGTIRLEFLRELYSAAVWISIAAMIWSVWSYTRRLFIGRSVNAAG
jgi:CDP-diacylglycerol--glycerol-3-phosphate 3-phosphatidyltransferase